MTLRCEVCWKYADTTDIIDDKVTCDRCQKRYQMYASEGYLSGNH